MSLSRFLVQVQAVGTALAAERVVNFVLVLILARGLGAEGFGLYATALSVAGLLEYLLDMGLSPVITRRAAREPASVWSWLPRVAQLKALLMAVCALAVAGVTTFASSHETLPLAAALAVGGLGCFSIGESFAAVLAGLQRFGEKSAWLISYRLANLAGLALSLHLGVSSVPVLMAVTVGLSALYAGLLGFWVARALPFRRGDASSREGWPALVREGFPFIVGNVLSSVPMHLPTVAVSAGVGLAAAGEFQIAQKLFFALGMIPGAVGTVAFSHMAAKAGAFPSEAWGRYHQGNGLLLLVGIWAGLVLAILSGPLVVLLFGEGYRGAGPVLLILAAGSPAFFLNHTASQALGAVGRQGSAVLAQATGAGTVIVGVLLAHSAVGLAMALVAAEVVRCFAFSAFVRVEAGRWVPADWWMGPAAVIPGTIAVSIFGWTLWGALAASIPFAAAVVHFSRKNLIARLGPIRETS